MRHLTLIVATGFVFYTSYMASAVHADDKQKDEAKESKMKTLAIHRTVAKYDGAPYRLCRGRTARCPQECGDSGEFATFSIVEYLEYSKPGKYGDPKQVKFSFQISDFNRKPKGDPQLAKAAAGLELNDLVLLEWRHLYGEVKPGLISPTRPVAVLKKLSEAEAKELRDAAQPDKKK